MIIVAEDIPVGITALHRATRRVILRGILRGIHRVTRRVTRRAIRRVTRRAIHRAIRMVIQTVIRFPPVHPGIYHSSSSNNSNNNNFSNTPIILIIPITPITDHRQVGREDRLNNQCTNLRCMLVRVHGLVAVVARHRLVGDLDQTKWVAMVLVWWK
jgi:hypothetical protein